jgi:hypothetical protein
MKPVARLLFCFVFILFVIRSSFFWLPWVWPLPSQAKPLGPNRFPPNLRLELPEFGPTQKLRRKPYLYTDAQGALIHPFQRPTSYLIVGSHRTSGVFIKPEFRWTSLVSLPLLNFSYPSLYYDEIPDLVRQLLGTLTTPITHIIIVPDTGIHHESFRSVLWDLHRYRIWDEELTAHPLYEFLFLSSVKWMPFSDQFFSKNTDYSPPQIEPKTLDVFTKKDIPAFEENLLRLKTELQTKSIQLMILLLPLDPEAKLYRRALREALRTHLPKQGLVVFDLDPCWHEAQGNNSFFIGGNDFTEEGHQIIAKCFDRAMRK